MAGSAVDADILTKIATPQINPIAIMGQVADVGRTMSQNKLLRQQIDTNAAISDAMKASTDPNTGQIDQNKLTTIVKNDPRAQADLPGTMNQLQSYQQGQLKIADAHLTMMSNRVAGLLATPPGQLSSKTVLTQMGQMLSEGLITPNEFATETTNLPQDENGIRQWLTGHLNRNLESKQKLDAILGQTVANDTGPSIAVSNISPETGVHPVATISKGLTPSEALSPQQIGVTPTNAPVMGTLPQFAQAAGAAVPPANPVVTPATGSNTPSAMTGLTSNIPDATSKTAGASPATPTADMPPSAGAPSPAQTPAGATLPGHLPGVPMSVGVPRAQYLGKAGADAAEFKHDLDTRVEAGSQLVQRMQESIGAMNQFTPGAAAPIREKAARIAQMWNAPQNIVDAVAGGNLGAIQEFNKFAVQQATEALKQTLGANRIALMEFNTFQKANPNLESDPRAIQKMYNFANKLYERDKAEQDYFNIYSSNSNNDITQFPNAWQNEMVRRGIISPAEVGIRTGPTRLPPGRNTPQSPTKPSTPGQRRPLSEIIG